MLYQNVRPKSFSEVIGNDAIIKALKRIVKRTGGDKPHTFLFSGPSGCGKTTLARILASELGCSEQSIIELNAANTNGIGTIRDVTTNAIMGSVFSTDKAYIIDESHQLTKNAQEGLNKIIEDTPTHCHFIFCTTEPQNLLKTILNRCSKYVVKPLTEDQVLDLLCTAIEKANLNLPDPAVLNEIVKCSDGCPREALTLLEIVSDAATKEDALDLLFGPHESNVDIFNLSKLLMLKPNLRIKRSNEAFEVLDTLTEEPEKIRRSLLGIMWRNLRKTDASKNIEIAKNIVEILDILSKPVYDTGKMQLRVRIAQCCFIEN